MGNANNIRWGCFDIIQTSNAINIIRVPTKTNENTLYIPIVSSLYMEEYKLEDIVDFVKQEADYFNNLPAESKVSHPSTLWYLEHEGCFAVNFPSVSATRMKITIHQNIFEPTRIPDVNTKGLYNITGIDPAHNTDVQDALSTTGERHCEAFGLIKCTLFNTYQNNKTFCKTKDTSGNYVYIADNRITLDSPSPELCSFIHGNIGPVFHLDTDKVCDHQFCLHYTTNNFGAGTRELDGSGRYGMHAPYMVLGKKTGNSGELSVSVQSKGRYIHLRDERTDSLMYFMKYDTNNAIQVCEEDTYSVHIHFNPKIGGIKVNPTPIANKKFTVYYYGDIADATKPLLFHSAFIDLEDNTTRYEMITAAERTSVVLLKSVADPLIVKKFEGDITYVSPATDPFGIPSGKMFRFLMLTTGFLHGKKLWKYQSTIPTDFLTIYQSGSLYHSFTNPNNLQLTTGDLFEIREEIPMTICSFGPCGESETDAVKATTINTGYKHVYMAIEIERSQEYASGTSQNYSYSQECIFGPYRSFNTVQNGHDFYLVKCLDLNKLETEFGYEVNIKVTLKHLSGCTGVYDTNKKEISVDGGATHVLTYFCNKTKILKIQTDGNGEYTVLGTYTPDKSPISSNFLSKYKVYTNFTANGRWGGEGTFTLVERQDKLFIVAPKVPVSIEVYLRKI